jgi:hypothetical protein
VAEAAEGSVVVPGAAEDVEVEGGGVGTTPPGAGKVPGAPLIDVAVLPAFILPSILIAICIVSGFIMLLIISGLFSISLICGF